MNLLRNVLILILLGGACCFTGTVAWKTHRWRAWHDVQHRQLQWIHPWGEIPPQGWDQPDWAFNIGIFHNVWGNALYSPDHAQASHLEMEELERQLKQIVTNINRENSFDQTDQIHKLLLSRGRHMAFLRNCDDHFLSFRKSR